MSKNVLCGCCGSLIKEGVVFCRSCGVRRQDLPTPPAHSMRPTQQAEPDKIEDEEIEDWYRHREWKPEEGRKEFKPTRIENTDGDGPIIEEITETVIIEEITENTDGDSSTPPVPAREGGYNIFAASTAAKEVETTLAEATEEETEELAAEVPTGEVLDLAQGLATSILVGASSAASLATDEADRVHVAEEVIGPSSLAGQSQEEEREAQSAAATTGEAPMATKVRPSSDASRIDMLPWWREALAAVEVHRRDGDTAFELDAPSITSGEAWACGAASGSQCVVDVHVQSSFDVEMMETTQSGYRMQTSSSGIMVARLRLTEESKIVVIAEKIEGATVVTQLAKEAMLPLLEEKLNASLGDFFKEVEEKIESVVQPTDCDLLD